MNNDNLKSSLSFDRSCSMALTARKAAVLHGAASFIWLRFPNLGDLEEGARNSRT